MFLMDIKKIGLGISKQNKKKAKITPETCGELNRYDFCFFVKMNVKYHKKASKKRVL